VIQFAGDPEKAGVAYSRALAIKPDFVSAVCNIGAALYELKLPEQAAAWYSKSIEMDWTYDLAYNRLGILLRDKLHQDAAIRAYQIAVTLVPNQGTLYNNIGSSCQSLGKVKESAVHYERALKIIPTMTHAWNGYIFTLDLDPTITPEEHQRVRGKFEQTQPAQTQIPHTNAPEGEKKLKIGYVSGDFWEHSAAYIFGGMITEHDRENFELFCYSNGTIDDPMTARFKACISNWRNIYDLSDQKAYDLIRKDGIDILIDLSGHSAGNRLAVFAMKPAPIQVHAWGYATGTGLKAIDYYFADETVLPPDEQKYHAEKIHYLPCLVTSSFPNEFPPVGQLPAEIRGNVTFGSFNRIGKISDEAYEAWAKILHAVPNSELLMKTAELSSKESQNRITAKFLNYGISGDRIIYGGHSHWQANVALMREVDIVLDSFPHGGGVTAMECLMMGVPYVSKLGTTLGSRGSSSILKNVGLGDWVAHDVDEYIKIAVEKANDLEALAKLRGELRGMFKSSVVGDSKQYCQIVEGEYRKIWQKWCSEQEMRQAA